tara:strand:- start:1523 stop:2338 length:816 start_codon:yes stop_codon:yes gene_type:complete
MLFLFNTSVSNNLDNPLLSSLSIFLISFISNTFSAISGGGAGLLQLPALILSGIPYSQALASHKLATVALGIGGSLRNYKSCKNDLNILWQILFFGLPGVVFGASIVEFISEEILYLLLGIFSIFLSLFSLRQRELGLKSGNIKLTKFEKIRFAFLIFMIGILNGSLSSGTGLFVTILLIKTFEIDFLRAISLTFVTVGIFWNLTGAILLSKIGPVPPEIMFLLILGSFSGGFLGAHLSKLKGNKLVRRTFILVTFLVGTSLLFKFIGIYL